MKEYKNKSGIYQIRNTVNGKLYVGKTKCFYKRYYQYVSDVRSLSVNRINNYLLSSFIKYGFDSFEFSVIEFCSISECSEKELYWILKLQCTDRNKGYNLRLDSSTGMITHVDTSNKISSNLKKQWSEGVRDGHSEKLKESWSDRDKEFQKEVFTRTLTKYIYHITYPDGYQEYLMYKEVAEKGYKSILSNFHRKKTTIIKYKDLMIERILIEDQV